MDEVRARLWCVLCVHGISPVRAGRQLWAAGSGVPSYSLDTHTHSGPGSAQAEPAPQNPEPSVNRMIEFKGR